MLTVYLLLYNFISQSSKMAKKLKQARSRRQQLQPHWRCKANSLKHGMRRLSFWPISSIIIQYIM